MLQLRLTNCNPRWIAPVKLSLLTLLVFSFGCQPTGRDASVASINRDNMQRLTNMYTLFQMQNGWVGPQDKEEFVMFITAQSERTLNRVGIDPANVESAFVGERDNKPLVIRYGVVGSSRGSDKPVVFESEGRKGVKRVSFTSKKIVEVTSQDEYDAYLAGENIPDQEPVNEPKN